MTFRGKLFWGLLFSALACAPAAYASGNVVSKPPSRADRQGLLRAFNHVHRSRSRLRLVGFRVDTAKSAAAYYLILAPGGSSYASGYAELYRRTHGHSWRHVAHFRNTTRDWNDANGLGPGFLWAVSSVGSGTFDSHATSTATDGSSNSSAQTHDSFTWNTTFSGGNPILLQDAEGHSFNAPPTLSGQMTASSTTTYLDAPPDSNACSGPISESASTSGPSISFATYPEYGTTRALDFRIDLAGALNWPSCSSDFDTPDDARFVVGVRLPAAVAGSHGIFNPASGLSAHPIMQAHGFAYPVDDMAPGVIKDSQPSQSSSDNGTTTSQSLNLTGTLHFKLVGLWMPLGWLSTPAPPVPADGHVPPVL